MARSRLTQLTRSHEWWDHKTPQILSLAYATVLLTKSDASASLGGIFLLMIGSLVLIAIYASIINDLTDIEIDLACGKSNMLQALSPVARGILVATSLGFVLFAAYIIYPRFYAVVFYLSICLTISLYSFPPFRLKEKGIWGVISCACAEHMFPSLFAVSILFYFSGSEINWVWITSTSIVSLMYGLRSIIWHQFLDKENDMRSGIKTFASLIDECTFVPKGRFIMAVELIALLVFLTLLNLWITYVALGLYLIFIFWRQLQFKSKIIFVISPRKQYFQIFMLDYYTIFLPLSILVYAAWTQPHGWVALVLHTMFFYKIIIQTVSDVFYLVRDTSKRFLTI